MTENQADILELLVMHELTIKRLYEAFAVQFENQRNFWSTIAKEEQMHADQLESFRAEATYAKWLVVEKRLKADALKLSIGYIGNQAVEAEAGRFNLTRALSTARDIESALLEKVFYRVGDFIPQEIRPILANITTDSERHRRSIAALLDAQKRQS